MRRLCMRRDVSRLPSIPDPTEDNVGAYDRNTAIRTDIEQLPMHYATDLTKGGGLAHIQLHDQIYTLRITRSGKLILTK